jgi:hypothetical protein
MKNKMLIALILILIVISGVFWFQKRLAEKKVFQAQQELRVEKIAQDSLVKISDGYYQKLVADTLTGKQLKDLAEEIIELKNRKPIYVTKTIIQPVEVLKETDNITVEKDSVFIEDYYPSKEKPFLKYTNKFSLITEKGTSNFKFEPITLKEVVTEKEDGFYQIDFKGPDFLEVQSINIQTEPIIKYRADNWGTLIGVEYGKNLDTNLNMFEINAYQRYKKFYVGIAVSSNKDLKGGIKIEF